MQEQDKFSCVVVDWNYAYDLCRDISKEIKDAGFKPEVVIGIARGGWYLARVLCDFFLLKDLFSLKMEHWGVTATITGAAELIYGLDNAARKTLSAKKVLIADDVTDTGDSIKLVVEYVKSLRAKDVKTATLHHKTSSSFVPDFYGELIYGLDNAARKTLSAKKVLIADDVTDTGDSIKLVVEYVKSLRAKDVKTATLHHKTSSSFVPDFYGELVKEWKWVIYPWNIHEDVMNLVGKVIAKGGKWMWMSLDEIRVSMKEEFDFYVSYHLLKEVLENMEFHGKIKKEEKGGKEVWLLR